MRSIDLSNVKTYPLAQRRNLVHLDDLLTTDRPPPPFDSPELDAVVAHVIAARRAGRPVIWMMGGHVIKSGLSRLLIDLMRRGIVTHVAGNGAVSIHDFELALIGETSEDVATSLEDGTFGMADETGRLMNRAIQEGVRDGIGYGASIGRFIAEHAELFPFRDVNVLYQAYTLGIPATIHATIGTDIIHQHPTADFGALGMASGLGLPHVCRVGERHGRRRVPEFRIGSDRAGSLPQGADRRPQSGPHDGPHHHRQFRFAVAGRGLSRQGGLRQTHVLLPPA